MARDARWVEIYSSARGVSTLKRLHSANPDSHVNPLQGFAIEICNDFQSSEIACLRQQSKFHLLKITKTAPTIMSKPRA
jgi:hypothetical protein